MLKFASFQVISAAIAPRNLDTRGLRRWAHRHHFDYEPRPGYLYVRSRAISSRCNDNFDEFPAEEIKKSYATFVGKPVFVNHNNSDHRRMRGVIIDAALHEDVLPDGKPDTWAEVLMEIDAVKFPKLAQAIVKRDIDRTSMGTDVQFSVCSACNNKATNPTEYCQHIPKMKGQRIYRTTASGTKEGVLIREICYGLGFFENSLLVEEPADPTAYFLGVDTRGLDKSASKTFPASDFHSAKDGQKCSRWGCDNPATHSRTVGGKELGACSQHKSEMTKKAHEEFHLSDDARREMMDAASAGQMAGEMHDHGERRTVNLSDPHDLDSHMDHHGYGYDRHDGQLWRNSYDPDHPALEPGYDEDRPLHPHEIRRMHDWEHGHGVVNDHPDYNGGEPDHFMGDSHFHTASRVLAYGETVAPQDVDTLRDDACPVCGEAEAYDGQQCQVCDFVAPPDMFMDPDLDMAKQVDLRGQTEDTLNAVDGDGNGDGVTDMMPGATPMSPDQVPDPMGQGSTMETGLGPDSMGLGPDGQAVPGLENEPGDGQPDLVCENCGFTSDSAPPMSVNMQNPDDHPQGTVSGDQCPNCLQGILLTQEEVEQLEVMKQQEMAGAGSSAPVQ